MWGDLKPLPVIRTHKEKRTIHHCFCCCSLAGKAEVQCIDEECKISKHRSLLIASIDEAVIYPFFCSSVFNHCSCLHKTKGLQDKGRNCSLLLMQCIENKVWSECQWQLRNVNTYKKLGAIMFLNPWFMWLTSQHCSTVSITKLAWAGNLLSTVAECCHLSGYVDITTNSM